MEYQTRKTPEREKNRTFQANIIPLSDIPKRVPTKAGSELRSGSVFTPFPVQLTVKLH